MNLLCCGHGAQGNSPAINPPIKNKWFVFDWVRLIGLLFLRREMELIDLPFAVCSRSGLRAAASRTAPQREQTSQKSKSIQGVSFLWLMEGMSGVANGIQLINEEISLWVSCPQWNEVSLLFVSFIHEWWKANERQWNEGSERRPKRSAVREQTTQQPLIAAGRGKPAINWWLVCFSSLPFLSIRAACSPPPPAHSALGLFAGAPLLCWFVAQLFSSFICWMKGRERAANQPKQMAHSPHTA